MVAFSVLDLTHIIQGSSAGDALRNTRDLAQLAERLGYTRYWLAEHHNMTGIASAATSLVISHVAAGTSTIRVGSGGIMLPNHSPLVIAEQFGTLEALYPGRIDLGLGRAPGTDQRTLRALRRDNSTADTFPQDVVELQALLGPVQAGQAVQAVPGGNSNVPIWILGSSVFGAQLAAVLGLPYAFASHFAPDSLFQALKFYRDGFKPSRQLQKPHIMVGANIVAAETDAEAKRLFTSIQQSFAALFRGTRGQLPPPLDDIDSFWSPSEKAQASHMLAYAIVGSPETVRRDLGNFMQKTGADEVMVTSAIYDHAARRRSYEIVADVCKTLG